MAASAKCENLTVAGRLMESCIREFAERIGRVLVVFNVLIVEDLRNGFQFDLCIKLRIY